jgi:hypothetical protein
VRYIRQRSALVEKVRNAGGNVSLVSAYDRQRNPPVDGFGRPIQVPIWRSLLGDEAVVGLLFPDAFTREERDAILEYFPEAKESWPAMPLP